MSKTVSKGTLVELDDMMSAYDYEIMKFLVENGDLPEDMHPQVKLPLTQWSIEDACEILEIPNYMAPLLVGRLNALGLVYVEHEVDRRVPLRRRKAHITYKGIQMFEYMTESEME